MAEAAFRNRALVRVPATANIRPAAHENLLYAAAKARNNDDVKAQLTANELVPGRQDDEDLARSIDAPVEFWVRVLTKAGVKPG